MILPLSGKPRELYPGKVAVGIDARDGVAAVDGWARATTKMSALELGRNFVGRWRCYSNYFYTDIARDGVLSRG